MRAPFGLVVCEAALQSVAAVICRAETVSKCLTGKGVVDGAAFP